MDWQIEADAWQKAFAQSLENEKSFEIIICSCQCAFHALCSFQIAQDSLDSALQIREEWDLAEEKLLDLKRLQRRMSIGSMAGMQQVTVKRHG